VHMYKCYILQKRGSSLLFAVHRPGFTPVATLATGRGAWRLLGELGRMAKLLASFRGYVILKTFLDQFAAQLAASKGHCMF